MDKKESTESWIERVYNKATAPKTIIICGFAVLILYIGLVGIGVLVAALTKPPYTIWDNWISDLGSSDHTAVPILYDLACIFAGTLTIPITLYLEKYLAPIPRITEELPPPHRWSYRLTGIGFFFSMIGSFFYIGVGIWSGDRAMLNGVNMHEICSFGAFGGFAFAAIFMGLALTISDRKLVPSPWNYILAAYGMHGPILVAMLNMTGIPGVSGPFLEWALLFAILGWIVPLSLFILRHAEKLIHAET